MNSDDNIYFFTLNGLPFQRSHDAKYLAVSSQDGYSTLVEFENGELGSPLVLSGQLFLLQMPDSVPSPSPSPSLPKNLMFLRFHFEPEVKSVMGDEKKSPAQKQKPEDMKVEETTAQVVTVSADSRKREVERKDDLKEASQNATSGSASAPKPAKRRITPVSIDLS